ncbi:polysaccharide biosynthesis protein [Panacibacter sp. DH6]|uniref:Polysaccharide biosynthesis protein n=1 Tax=Panacibacter microcysteis TaxID=2793269 RepID=A0A931GYS8_9BACT|nr:polysaccharide biosynthesis C-terminal domain-containing protein [Panacibacter microcysteis]MBG9377577.1 polysaccharide biosynthesis protein [Panacibacter microcysteis]
MSGIRKQAIISSIVIYIGVAVGVLNTYLFVTKGTFSQDQYALTRLFNDIGQNFYIIASLGIIPIVYKFYPYYKDNLPEKEIDLLSRAFVYAAIGFLLVAIGAYFFEPVIVQKFGTKSKLLVDYYLYIIPYFFGYLLFSLLEGYAWALQKTILPHFLKETGMRLYILLLACLYLFEWIDFKRFMQLFSLAYVIMAVVLLIYLVRTGRFKFHFKASRVTKKFKKKMLAMQIFIFGGIVVSTIGQTIDGLMIASIRGLEDAAVYLLALYTSSLMQIPVRSIQAIATGVLVRLWKDKNLAEIKRIYYRSSINLLLIALFIFGNVWLNIADALDVFNVQEAYKAGIPLVFIFGIIRVIDAGTGLNAQVIGSSTYWRFEFLSGVVMLALRIPLVYVFVKEFGIIGSVYGDFISLTVYNFIRFEFLRRKFGFQPFSNKTVIAIVLALVAYAVSFWLFRQFHGFVFLLLRSAVFSGIMIGGIFLFNLTPDALQIMETVKKRLKLNV